MRCHKRTVHKKTFFAESGMIKLFTVEMHNFEKSASVFFSARLLHRVLIKFSNRIMHRKLGKSKFRLARKYHSMVWESDSDKHYGINYVSLLFERTNVSIFLWKTPYGKNIEMEQIQVCYFLVFCRKKLEKWIFGKHNKRTIKLFHFPEIKKTFYKAFHRGIVS